MADDNAITIEENRFAHYTATDHSAPVWVATLLSLIFSFLVLTVRLAWVKWKRHALDDLFLIIAQVLGCAHWGCIISSLNSGLAKAETPVSAFSSALLASRIFLFLALALTKISILSFIRSLFAGNYVVSHTCLLSIALSGALGLASILAIAIPHNPIGPSLPTLTTLLLLDATSELALLLLPIAFLWRTHMPRHRKLIVIFAFATRFPSVLACIVAFIEVAAPRLQPGVKVMGPVVVQNVYIATGLISTTIPCLRGFVGSFTTGGMGYTNTATLGGSAGNSGGSYQLQSLERREVRKSVAVGSGAVMGGALKVKGEEERLAAASISSQESQRVMIRRGGEEEADLERNSV